MKGINVVTAYQLKHWDSGTAINGAWTPARPIGRGGFFRRCKIAWKVFTGKYDAVKWHGQ